MRSITRLPTTAAIVLGLSSCARPASADPNAGNVLWNGGVAKIAEAPDGTILWAARDRGEIVYFAGANAHWSTTETCGKNCTKTVQHDVPTAVPMAN